LHSKAVFALAKFVSEALGSFFATKTPALLSLPTLGDRSNKNNSICVDVAKASNGSHFVVKTNKLCQFS
jgi:hypothetical protein